MSGSVGSEVLELATIEGLAPLWAKAQKEEDAKEVHDSASAQKSSQFCWGGGKSELYRIVDF